jgi:exodeoxyribonuclease VII small subunit
MAKKDETLKFEAALAKLEEIVGTLESGDLELDRALELFSEGTAMAKICRTKLSEAEKKIEKLVKERDGDVGVEPMADPTDESPF